MKKYLIFIVGIIIGVAGTSYAAYKLKAEQVSFDKSNTGLNSDNVQGAIDELATGILTYGDAEANDIKEGKTALVNGQKITGTFKTNVVKYLGKGTNFNLSDYSNYKSFSEENFIVSIISGPAVYSNVTTDMSCNGSCSTAKGYAGGFNVTKTYNKETGILQINGCSQSVYLWRNNVNLTGPATQNFVCSVYLVDGVIS